MNRTQEKVLSFLVGVGAGVGLGLMFAPQAGGDMRRAIRDRADDLTEQVKVYSGEVLAPAREWGSDSVDKARHATSDLAEKFHDSTAEVFHAVQETIASGGCCAEATSTKLHRQKVGPQSK